MGIVNLTPDSFSGDGLAAEGMGVDDVVAAAVAQARAFVEAGAEIVDVGAERPRLRGAYGDHAEVDAESEAAVAVPVVRALADDLGDRAIVSIDTSKGSVAHAALGAGAGIVNDVWRATRPGDGGRSCRERRPHRPLMHNQEEIRYPNGVFDDVISWLREAIDAAQSRGVPRDRIIVDPHRLR